MCKPFFFNFLANNKGNLAAAHMKNKQEFRGTPRCTGSQIVDFGINLSKLFNDRNTGTITKERVYQGVGWVGGGGIFVRKCVTT